MSLNRTFTTISNDPFPLFLPLSASFSRFLEKFPLVDTPVNLVEDSVASNFAAGSILRKNLPASKAFLCAGTRGAIDRAHTTDVHPRVPV